MDYNTNTTPNPTLGPQLGEYDPGDGGAKVQVAVKTVPVDDQDAQAALQVVT